MLSAEDEEALRKAGGQKLVDEYKAAKRITSQTTEDFLKEHAAEILEVFSVDKIYTCLIEGQDCMAALL